jgi:hypothetical protein
MLTSKTLKASNTFNMYYEAMMHLEVMEQIMEVLKVCVAQGVSRCSIGAPILAEELDMPERRTNSD